MSSLTLSFRSRTSFLFLGREDLFCVFLAHYASWGPVGGGFSRFEELDVEGHGRRAEDADDAEDRIYVAAHHCRDFGGVRTIFRKMSAWLFDYPTFLV